MLSQRITIIRILNTQIQQIHSIDNKMHPKSPEPLHGCRPLVVLQAQPSVYLPIPYGYRVGEIESLQSYLCPHLKINGIDFQQDIKEEECKNIKYKIVGVKGFVRVKDKPKKLEEKNVDQLVRMEWTIGVAIIELDGKANQFLSQLKTKLISSILILDKNKNYIQQQEIALPKLKETQIQQMPITGFRTAKSKNKLFINLLPIKLLLPKQQTYKKQYIVELIAEDLLQAVTIMWQNSLSVRVVEWHQGLIPIQNYYSGPEQKDPEFEKLVKPRNPTLVPEGKLNKREEAQQRNVKSNSKNNIQIIALALFLILLVGGYVLFRVL